MRNNLAGARCYLAGAIEKTGDYGIEWRDCIKRGLAHLRIHWLDPCDKPIDYARETPETSKLLLDDRLHGRVSLVKDRMDPVRAVDLRMVDISDFIIVNLLPGEPTFGTHEEVQRASSQNKPVIIRIDGGLKATPFWWYSQLDHKLFFDTWLNVRRYLGCIASYDGGDLPYLSDNKWLLFDWTGEDVT